MGAELVSTMHGKEPLLWRNQVCSLMHMRDTRHRSEAVVVGAASEPGSTPGASTRIMLNAEGGEPRKSDRTSVAQGGMAATGYESRREDASSQPNLA